MFDDHGSFCSAENGSETVRKDKKQYLSVARRETHSVLDTEISLGTEATSIGRALSAI